MTIVHGAAGRLRGYPELLVAALLLILGATCLVDAAFTPTNAATRGPLGSSAMPTAVGIMLVITSLWLAFDVVRGGTGEVEAGEDIDLDQPAEWRAVVALGAVFVGSAYLLEPLGWPLAGAILYLGCVTALGSRHYVRNVLIALAMSFGTFYLFVLGLGVALSAGPLNGVL